MKCQYPVSPPPHTRCHSPCLSPTGFHGDAVTGRWWILKRSQSDGFSTSDRLTGSEAGKTKKRQGKKGKVEGAFFGERARSEVPVFSERH